MLKLAALVVIAASLAGFGCLSSAGSSPITSGDDGGISPDAGPPVQTVDGSVPVDAGGATATTFTTGLGSGVIAHSANFTIITKTGQEPGGAGVKSSTNFTVISGAAPAASAH
jgi:hypothetical protein